jgi:glutathione peroxidase
MLKVLAMLLVFTAPGMARAEEAPMQAQDSKLYSFTMKDIDGRDKSLADYKGKVLLIVNVASQCGNTPQYTGLEAAFEKYQKQGFEILGFPANNFGHQEPGTDKEIKEFCDTNFHVSFPMFSKIEVKGDHMDPLYKYLTTETDYKGSIGWNFAKFLVDRQGKVIARYSPRTTVEEKSVMADIEKALAKP